MKFINYCIIVLNDPGNIRMEINNIADSGGKIKWIESTGIVISTFTSLATPSELSDYFTQYNHNFFLFDLDKDSSGYNLTRKTIEHKLFSHLTDSTELEDRKNRLMEEINKTPNMTPLHRPNVPTDSGSTINDLPELNVKITSKYIRPESKTIIDDSMNKDEITLMVNELLDKGMNNLTDADKIRFSKLSKLLEKY